MYKKRVMEDLAYSHASLREADEFAERSLRNLVKTLIRDNHTPRNSDLSPIGGFFRETIKRYFAARQGNVEEANASADELMKFSRDPHYRKREQLNEAIDIAEHIQVQDLLDFYQATKGADLEFILPGWKRRKNVLVYRRVQDKI